MTDVEKFAEKCADLLPDQHVLADDVSFDTLFLMKGTIWWSLEITATLTCDAEMHTWNGNHPVNENTTKSVCTKGTQVRVWMVSRFGDVGITANLKNPCGYDIRLDPSKLKNWVFKRVK